MPPIRLSAAMVAEAVGSFALTFIGIMAIHSAALPNTGQSGLLLVAMAHGLILALLVTATMPASGGHLNPAVTIMFLLTGEIRFGSCIGYIIAQLFGGVVAGFAAYGCLGANAGATQAVFQGTPMLTANVAVWVGILAEVIATFLLCFVIWGSAADPRAKQVGGFAIGLTIAADIMAIGPITGASMNPQRTFGPALAYTILNGGNTNGIWNLHWIYWVGPVLGAVLAGVIYRMILWPRADQMARDVPASQRPR